jgi:hypothetical protein
MDGGEQYSTCPTDIHRPSSVTVGGQGQSQSLQKPLHQSYPKNTKLGNPIRIN